MFTFPSYAKKTPKDLDVVGKVRPSDIQLRNDKTGECWLVGQAAETMMDQVDIESTTDSSTSRGFGDVYKRQGRY